MARRISWSRPAQHDRRTIFTYWNKNNQSNLYSRKLNRLFNEAIITLSKYPFIGRSSAILNVHIKVVRDYLIVYEVLNEEIVILRIWDGRQDSGRLPL